jgi:hypothetical protein
MEITLTLNHLRPWRPNPLLSTWHGLHSLPFDFASHPIHLAEQLAVAHDSPLQRKSWQNMGPGFVISLLLSTTIAVTMCVFLPLSTMYVSLSTIFMIPCSPSRTAKERTQLSKFQFYSTSPKKPSTHSSTVTRYTGARHNTLYSR